MFWNILMNIKVTYVDNFPEGSQTFNVQQLCTMIPQILEFVYKILFIIVLMPTLSGLMCLWIPTLYTSLVSFSNAVMIIEAVQNRLFKFPYLFLSLSIFSLSFSFLFLLVKYSVTTLWAHNFTIIDDYGKGDDDWWNVFKFSILPFCDLLKIASRLKVCFLFCFYTVHIEINNITSDNKSVFEFEASNGLLIRDLASVNANWTICDGKYVLAYLFKLYLFFPETLLNV